MTYKPIEYSPHAVERMELRNQARGCPLGIGTGTVASGALLEGTGPPFSKRGVVGGRALEVVYTEDAHRVLVITVAWTG